MRAMPQALTRTLVEVIEAACLYGARHGRSCGHFSGLLSSRGGPFASMRPRREVLLTTFADPSTFPSVFETPASTEDTAAPVEVATESFADFGLPSEMVRVLTREGITTPFEIQSATMPDALAGRDVLGRGQTGAGKTLDFGLPLLGRVAQGGRAM